MRRPRLVLAAARLADRRHAVIQVLQFLAESGHRIILSVGVAAPSGLGLEQVQRKRLEFKASYDQRIVSACRALLAREGEIGFPAKPLDRLAA
jgi:hypothetical protein